MTKVIDEKELRKAWLKRKFGSFEYHEEMLHLHRQWIDVLRKALARAEQDTSPNRPESGYKTIADEARNFRTETMPLIERNDDLGKYRKAEWHRYCATATFRSIPDYSRYLQSEGDMLSWLTPQEDEELTKYWAPMARMAHNIQYTVDEMWTYDGTDDLILNERSTGPIDWPSNWRDDVADLAGTAPHQSIEAGQPCPREGWWFTPAKAGSRRHFQQGEVMPAFTTDYGATLWQWDEQQ